MEHPILIKNALIVTMNINRDVIEGDVLIEGSRITAVNASPELYLGKESLQIIDAQGQVLIPGLVQTHIHLCQTLFRGQADDLALLDWLKMRIWPLEASHDEESLYISALLGVGELFRGGTTSIIDMETVRHTSSALQAIIDTGIRAISGKCMMDWGEEVPPGLMETTEDSLRESVELLEKWHGKGDGRLQYAFNPRFAVSCTEALLKEVGKLACHYKVKIHTHASENQGEIALVEQERGMRNVVYFEHLGLADENLILAHCIWLDEQEMDILQRRKVKVVHCPSCNLKLGSGIAPIPEMLKRNICVSIGADGAPCNNNLDQFTEMRTASLIQKPIHGPTAMPAWQTFEMATLGGAQAMGLEKEIGSVEAGKKADLALVNLTNLHCMPREGTDIYAQLVYQARSSDVTLTMVDGRIVYQDGVLKSMDEDWVMKQSNTALQRVASRAGLIKTSKSYD